MKIMVDENFNLLTMFYEDVGRGYKWFLNKNKKDMFKKELAIKLSRTSYLTNFMVLKEYLETIYSLICEELFRNSYTIIENAIIKTASNLTIDRGAGPIHVIFEVGIAVHPIFGIPFIPGSSLKGAFSHYSLKYAEFMHTYVKKKSGGEYPPLFSKYIKWLLGRDRSGISLIFFSDAYPVLESGDDTPLIIPDIMTPHYKADVKDELHVNPIPILQLVVSKGVKFKFIMALSNRRLSSFGEWLAKENYRDVINVIKDDSHLKDKFSRYIEFKEEPFFNLHSFAEDVVTLMCEFGVGGKTNVGYSKFEVVSFEGCGR